MLREEYLRRLVDASYLDLYLSASGGAGGRIYWPWKMNPPKEALSRMRNTCEQYIIDSDPLDDSVTTQDVLDCAAKYNAEVASLQDVYQNKDKTVDSLLNGLEVADDHPFDGDLLLPLQAPYQECYQELGEPDEMIGIGGLKDGSVADRIDAVESLRAVTGQNKHIHGFGWGVKGMEQWIRDNPEMLDSVDYSSPVQNAMNQGGFSGGEEMSSVIAMYASVELVRDLREVSAYIPTDEKINRDRPQTGLEAWQ